MLPLVIEEITLKNTGELVQEKIFKPPGMTRTGYIWHESFSDNNVAVGHLNNGSINQKKGTHRMVTGSLITGSI